MTTSKVKPIPDGYHTVTPYLIFKDAAKAIDFCKQAFGAVEIMRLNGPDGRVGHAELRIGDSAIMLADESPEMGARGPQSLGGSPVFMHLYVEDVNAVIGKAIAAGAKPLRPIQNMFYGDRAGSVTDPFGHVWHVSTHIEDLTPAQIRERSEAFMKQKKGEK